MAASSVDCMLQALEQLSEHELYEDAAYLGSILMSHCDADAESLRPADRVRAQQLYAKSLFEIGEYRKAEEYYYGALRALKERSLGSRSSSSRRNGLKCDPIEIESRYQLSRCLERQSKLMEAVGALDPVPPRLRPPKVSHALARLYAKTHTTGRGALQPADNLNGANTPAGPSVSALENYKVLLKEVPLCLDSMRHFLQLGGSQSSASELANESLQQLSKESGATGHWLDEWLCAQAALARHNNAKAVTLLRRLSTSGPLANNEHVLEALAQAYRQWGEPAKQLLILQRWRSADPHSLRVVAPLAAVLAQEKRVKELEQLAAWARRTAPDRTETWMALAHLSRAHGRPAEALFFASKATFNDDHRPRADAMLLKARVLMDSKRYPQAAQHIREAVHSSGGGGRGEVEAYEALVDCYLAQGRHKEAEAAARMALDALGHRSPRALLLAATVLSKHNGTVARAKHMLESAIKAAPHLLSAVHLLIELYDKSGEYDKAISLLRAQTSVHVNSNLHQMLGDLLSKANRAVEAVDCYKHAAILDPANAQKHAAALSASLSKSSHDCQSVVVAHVRPAADEPSTSLDEGESMELLTGGESASAEVDSSGSSAVGTESHISSNLFTPPDAALGPGTMRGGFNEAPRRPRQQRTRADIVDSVGWLPEYLATPAQESGSEVDSARLASAPARTESSIRSRLFEPPDDNGGPSTFGV